MEKTALVTGGSKGIGLAVVNKFLMEGFDVISVSRNEGHLKILKEKFPEQLHVFHTDLTNKHEVLAFGEIVKLKVKKLDILVNNAGMFVPGQIQSEEDGIFEMQMALNINAAYYLTRAVLPLMISHGEGYIFNISSTAGVVPYINGGSYCISKHAMLGLTKVLRQELMPAGIRVSAVLPGATLTDSWDGTELPDSRFILPENISECIWFAWQNRENCVMEEILLRPVKGDIV